MKKTILNVDGMSCEHCAKAVKSAVGALAGVQNIDVNLKNKTVEITHNESANIEKFKEEIEEQGYEII